MKNSIRTLVIITVATGALTVSCKKATSKENTENLTENTIKEEKVNTENLDLLVLKNQFALHQGLFINAIKDISEEEANIQINENTNSAKWIAGHTVWIAYSLGNLLGVTAENPYSEQFAFGKPFDPNGNYPSLETMISDWNSIYPEVVNAFDNINQETLNSEAPFPIPFNEQTIRGLLAFQVHHLAYEVGQLGLYRKFLGKEGLSYQ